jgi:hypothetical protein
VEQFRGGLVLKALRWLYHSTPRSRVTKKKRKDVQDHFGEGGEDVGGDDMIQDPPHHPLSSDYGTYKTVKARFWPLLSGKSPKNLSSCATTLETT